MAEDAKAKTLRVLSMFVRMLHGSTICKKEEAENFRVNEKTIQRDIEDLRAYLSDECQGGCRSQVIYSRKYAGYILSENESVCFKGEEILTIVKILLESRSLCKNEMEQILKKLVFQAMPQEKQMIEKLVGNERFHYAPVSHGKNLLAKIWELSVALKEKRRIRITYKKEQKQDSISRVIEPQGIIFSEYYFYLVACIAKADFDYPAVYRIDRIEEIELLAEQFDCAYCNRFEEGEFRKRVQFMKSGKILKLLFRYTGTSISAVLDRLPTAKVIKKESAGYLIEAEVYGDGIKMWLLGQAEYVEVLEPTWFRNEIKETIEKMAIQYESC